jgi:nucleoid DNA-binding protein
MTPGVFIAELSTRSGLTGDQVKTVLQAQAEMAYTHIHSEAGFPIPGIGVVQLIGRPARMIENKWGPKKGQSVQMPATKKLVFKYTEAAKAAFVKDSPVPKVLEVDWYPALEDLES